MICWLSWSVAPQGLQGVSLARMPGSWWSGGGNGANNEGKRAPEGIVELEQSLLEDHPGLMSVSRLRSCQRRTSSENR